MNATPPPDGDTADERAGYAFHMEPQVGPNGTSWTAAYPGAPWSVTGPTEADALQRLGDEFTRRQAAGEDPLAYTADLFRRHLRHAVPGVYAVDNDLYSALVHASPAERQRGVEEAERRRQLGQTYTLADHRG